MPAPLLPHPETPAGEKGKIKGGWRGKEEENTTNKITENKKNSNPGEIGDSQAWLLAPPGGRCAGREGWMMDDGFSFFF